MPSGTLGTEVTLSEKPDGNISQLSLYTGKIHQRTELQNIIQCYGGEVLVRIGSLH